MNNFSTRAKSILNGLAHLNNAPTKLQISAKIDWQYQLVKTGPGFEKFKILTLNYGLEISQFSNLELLIYESFSTLVESRNLEIVITLQFKELESYLRDFNNVPSIPENLVDEANKTFESVKVNFLVFLLSNEFLFKNSTRNFSINWSNSSLAEKAHFISEAVIFLNSFLGNFMPNRLISVSEVEIVCPFPVNFHVSSEQVIGQFLGGIGIPAVLKLVAV